MARRRSLWRRIHGLLAAGIAHEIGNPLSSMSAIVQILELKKAPPEIADRLKVLGTQVERIDRIVRDVSAFARPSSERRTVVPLQSVIDRALGVFRYHEKAKTIAVERAFPRLLPEVEVVEDQVVQVLLNLLLNAHDATPTGGAVTVELTRSEAHLTVTVADTGPGIAPELLERVFEPLFTTKARGSGLGLAISAGIAQAHGARLRASNRPAGGAVFTVEFPLAALASAVVALTPSSS